jgi:hypothetical protein
MTPFIECEKGHDLTTPDAYIYRYGGNRECRMCVQANTKLSRTGRGTF